MHSRFYLPFLVILWAALYLPGLGGMEIKGEEGRRILPAVAMLEEGHWITPSVAGETYLRKPPLINWAIAGSFALFDVRNEWAARLPSALCMLVLAAALYLGVRAALGAEAALLAALFALTNISSFEKGRLAEIEAMYVAFTGAAFAAWLGGCWTRKALWTGWLTAGFFLGLGMLTKGPAHLIFFYAAVAVPLLWNKRWKELFHPAHGAALVVTAALFLAWAIPHWNETRNLDVGGVWGEQLTGRILPSGFEFGQWLINFPRAILNFSPWILFAAALSHRRIRSHVPTEILSLAVPLAWGAVGSFFLVMALPGSIPRYTLPLMAPVCILAAIGCASPAWESAVRTFWARAISLLIPLVLCGAIACAIYLRGTAVSLVSCLLVFLLLAVWLKLRKRQELDWPLLAIGTGLLMAAFAVVYAWEVMPVTRRHEDVRPLAHPINAIDREGQPLVLLDPGFQPFLFYLREPVRYAQRPSEIPEDTRYVLVHEKRAGKVRSLDAWKSARAIASTEDKRGSRMILLRRETP